LKLLNDFLPDSHIARCIPACDKFPGIELADSRRKLMTELLCAFGKLRRIQDESAVVFDYSNRFTPAIEIRIDNPANGTLHNGYDYTPL
jgi:hypothetical protein